MSADRWWSGSDSVKRKDFEWPGIKRRPSERFVTNRLNNGNILPKILYVTHVVSLFEN
jgi:hypothetical protein